MTTPSFQEQVDRARAPVGTEPRWQGIRRDYTAADVVRLRGSVDAECTIARRGAERLWDQLHERRLRARARRA